MPATFEFSKNRREMGVTVLPCSSVDGQPLWYPALEPFRHKQRLVQNQCGIMDGLVGRKAVAHSHRALV